VQRLIWSTTRSYYVCCLIASASAALLSTGSSRISVSGLKSFAHAGLTTDYFPVTCSVPQGSVFGPLGFIAYTEDITVLSEKHRVHSHTYADDTQLDDSSTVADPGSVRDHLTRCVSDVAKWCASRRLQLNADKTEMICLGRVPILLNSNAPTSRSKSDPVIFSPAVSSVIWASTWTQSSV